MSGHNLTLENLTSSFNFKDPWCIDVWDQMFEPTKYLNFIYDAVGIPLNTWILVAILISTDLRAHMRNKILASICAQGLFDCLVFFPISLHVFLGYENFHSSCHTHRAYNVILYFSEFISNWNLVTLLALVLFTLYGSPVTLGCRNRLLTQAATYLIPVWPWFFSAITVIPMVLSNSKEYIDTWENVTTCEILIVRGKSALYALNIYVPACVAALLLAAVIFLKRKRARDVANGGNIARQLIGESSDSEPIIPYIAFVAVNFVCDFVYLLHFIYYKWTPFSESFCTL